MITVKELNDLGREPFLGFVMLIKAFLDNKKFQLAQKKQIIVMTTEEEAALKLELEGFFEDFPVEKPANVHGSFDINHTLDKDGTLRIPAIMLDEIKGLKFKESINQLVKDFVLEKFVDQYDFDGKAQYVSFTFEQNYLGHCEYKHGGPNTGENNKYWDLILEYRMSAEEVDKYLASILKIVDSQTRDTDESKHLIVVTEKELADVGKDRYLAFLKLLQTFVIDKSYGKSRPQEVSITGSLINEACGPMRDEIIALLVKDLILERFLNPEAEDDKIPEYISYYGGRNYLDWLHDGHPPEKRSPDDHYYDLHLKCPKSPAEIEEYISKIRMIDTRKYGKPKHDDESEHLVQKIGIREILIPEEQVADVGRKPLLELLRVIKSYMKITQVVKDSKLEIPNRDILAISGLRLEKSIEILVNLGILDKFVEEYKRNDDTLVESVSYSYIENSEGQGLPQQVPASISYYYDLVIRPAVTVDQISQCIASMLPSRDLQEEAPPVVRPNNKVVKDDKVCIVIDEENGIYLKDDRERIYPISGARRDYVITIYKNNGRSMQELQGIKNQDESVISRGIKGINSKVIETLGVSADLIVNKKTAGKYMLNKENFSFVDPRHLE
jgi:hypothetical protein